MAAYCCDIAVLHVHELMILLIYNICKQNVINILYFYNINAYTCCMTRENESAREFWLRVDKLMITRKLMLKDIAEGAGAPYQSFTGWRTRHKYPNAQVLVKIALILHTSAEYLVFGEKDHDNLKFSDIINHLEYASEDDIALIRRVLRIEENVPLKIKDA